MANRTYILTKSFTQVLITYVAIITSIAGFFLSQMYLDFKEVREKVVEQGNDISLIKGYLDLSQSSKINNLTQIKIKTRIE
jgi:hypothetical protein